MPDNRGGYQRPSNPAPVSGPGALSARTDGGPQQAIANLPNAGYGENAEFRSIQAGAPLAKAPSPGSAGSGGGQESAPAAAALPPPTPLTAPSQDPSQPVTAGASIGAGPNSMILPQQSSASSALQILQSNAGPLTQALLARLQNGL